MARILPSEDVRPLSEFRTKLASFVDHVRTTKRPLILTQHGRSVAVLVDVTEYERLVDELATLRARR